MPYPRAASASRWEWADAAGCCTACEEAHRIPLVRPLASVVASRARTPVATRSCSRSSWRSPPRSSASTARSTACTTSPGSSRARSRCSRRSVRAPSRIEIGTGVIDMRYENPLYMAEEAAAADLISAHAGGEGRLQLGVSRGSPEHGAQRVALVRLRAARGRDRRRPRTREDRAVPGRDLAAPGVAQPNPQMTGVTGDLPIEPQSPGLADRIWWGSGTRATAEWTAEQGMNLMSSTLLTEDTGVPFDQLQAEQIQLYRDAWAQAGLGAHAARLGVAQHHPARDRRGPRVLRRTHRQRHQGPGRLPRRRSRAVRQELHRRTRRDRRGARARTPPWPRPTPCS